MYVKAQEITSGINNRVIALNTWAGGVGIQPITAWRWRKLGWLKTVNISGRVYITEDALEDFTRRAAAGEFAKKHVAPIRTAAKLP
jgi:hypothetical protein